MYAWIYTILSVILVSIVSLIGIFFIFLSKKKLDKIVLFLVSLSAGSLFGGAFLHILPEIVEEKGFGIAVSLSLLGGVVVFFVIEKIVHWQHCHCPPSEKHAHHLAPMNIIGDGVHNFIDGLIIAASYLIDINVGIATTMAVLLHEIPQEIGDFGVLLHAGYSKSKALFFNFLSALLAVIGAIVGLVVGVKSAEFALLILPFAAGGFVYIAGADLIPELHKRCQFQDTAMHLFALLLGIGLMLLVKII